MGRPRAPQIITRKFPLIITPIGPRILRRVGPLIRAMGPRVITPMRRGEAGHE